MKLLFRRKFCTFMVLATLLPASSVFAASATDVKEKWHTPQGLYLSPAEALEMKNASPEKVVLIDIRTRAEIKYVGMADAVDINIPIRTLRNDYAWSEKSHTFRTAHNDDFIPAIEAFLAQKKLDKAATIILMCQSGSRNPIAARALSEAGYKNVYSQYQGFEGLKSKKGESKGKRVVNGWKNANLPWSYKLKDEVMYFTVKPNHEIAK